jgi:hypothetical protein
VAKQQRTDLFGETVAPPESNTGARTVRVKPWMEEKGRSRNLVIPDSLYDAMSILAIKTKITLEKGGRSYIRSLSVSEIACEAFSAYLVKATAEERKRSNGDLTPAD